MSPDQWLAAAQIYATLSAGYRVMVASLEVADLSSDAEDMAAKADEYEVKALMAMNKAEAAL